MKPLKYRNACFKHWEIDARGNVHCTTYMDKLAYVGNIGFSGWYLHADHSQSISLVGGPQQSKTVQNPGGI